MKPAAEKATAAWQRSSSSSADCSRSFLLNRPSSFGCFKKKRCGAFWASEAQQLLRLYSHYLGLRLVDIQAWVYSPLALDYLGGNGSDVTLLYSSYLGYTVVRPFSYHYAVVSLPWTSIVGLAASGQSVRPPPVALLEFI